MNYVVFFLMGMLGAILQSTMFRGGVLHAFTPDTTLLFVIYAATSLSFSRGLLLSFALGLLADLFSGAPEGWNTSYLTLIFMLGKGIQARVFFRGPRAAVGILLLALALKVPFFAILAPMARISFPIQKQTLGVWLGEITATLLLMPVVLYVLSRTMGQESASHPKGKQHAS